MRSIQVQDLLTEGDKRLGLKPLAGVAGLGRIICSCIPQRPGRQLIRESGEIRANRLLILGRAEMTILEGLSSSRKKALFRELSFLDVPCMIVESGLPVPEGLISFSQAHAIPLFQTTVAGPRLTRSVQGLLRRLLGPGFHVQGVFLRIFDVGVLIMGKSGIGKSECALDLVTRGHALVADDFVEIRRDRDGKVVGTSPEIIRHHIEVRGLGIISVLDLFGVESVAQQSQVDLVVELVEWDQFRAMDRTGLTQHTLTLLEEDIPMLRIPVSLNRNLAIILEVAVRNHLLQRRGIRPVEDLDRRLETQLRARMST